MVSFVFLSRIREYCRRQECPVIVAHIIMTCQRKQPQQPRLEPVGVAEAAETQQPLEQAPLCGPYM